MELRQIESTMTEREDTIHELALLLIYVLGQPAHPSKKMPPRIKAGKTRLLETLVQLESKKLLKLCFEGQRLEYVRLTEEGIQAALGLVDKYLK